MIASILVDAKFLRRLVHALKVEGNNAEDITVKEVVGELVRDGSECERPQKMIVNLYTTVSHAGEWKS